MQWVIFGSRGPGFLPGWKPFCLGSILRAFLHSNTLCVAIYNLETFRRFISANASSTLLKSSLSSTTSTSTPSPNGLEIYHLDVFQRDSTFRWIPVDTFICFVLFFLLENLFLVTFSLKSLFSEELFVRRKVNFLKKCRLFQKTHQRQDNKRVFNVKLLEHSFSLVLCL